MEREEAIEVVKKNYPHVNESGSQFETALRTLIPELAESEDEWIRKALIGGLKDCIYTDWYNGVSVEECIAWLEKQGKNSVRWNENTDGNKPQKNHSVLLKTIHGIAEGEWNSDDSWIQYRWSSKIKDSDVLYWMNLSELEKQGEYKSADDLTQQEAMDIAVAKCFEQGEQKLADKVESKFKVGDWIICCDYEPIQIIDIKHRMYYWSNGDIRPIEMVDSNLNIHLWTIQDAKNGDVLEYQGEIFIIRELKKKVIASRTIEYYCCYDGEHFINNSIYSLMDDDLVNIHPATKGQRDLLFQKMKEAGYTFDFEKKELKKIEDKPTWSEEDERLCQCIIEDQEEALDKVSNDKYGHSEIISDLKEMYHERINFLKSLKDRYTWKPSDEQMKVMSYLAKYYAVGIDEPNRSIITSLYEDLKKLREE